MISVQKKYLDMLKDILNLHLSNCEVRAFGSRVKGTNRKYSDFDLAIVGNGKLDNRSLWKLKNALMESRLPFRVDVLDYNAVSENFRKVIDSNYEVI
jgi:predicted nucleotidyltransferase